MEFDKSRVYTAVNADELPIGSKCIFADTLGALSAKVQSEEYKDFITILKRIYNDGFYNRFDTGDDLFYFAYFIESSSKPMYKQFESVEKAMEAIEQHGHYVIKTNNMMSAFLVTEDDKDQEESRIFIDGYWYDLQELCRLFVFADDDTPCGELVEE